MDIKNLEKAIELRHELHEHPELSNHEVWTKAHLIEFLQNNTSLEIVDKGKWFYAAYRGGGEKGGIGFRADFDALPIQETCDIPYRSKFPGLGHKCGHDGHAASLCALALELERTKPERDVFLVFQHAEETGDGARECSDFVPETGIKEIFAYHNSACEPLGQITVNKGASNCASLGMTVEMKGSPTHASLPELGVNPVFALASLATEIPEIADQSKYEQLVLATIVQLDVGDYAFGIAASEGRLRVTLRAASDDDLKKLCDAVEAASVRKAEQYGLKYSFSYEDVFPDTTNEDRSTAKVVTAAEKLGYTVLIPEKVNRGSEDFGHFLKQVPGALFFVGVGEDSGSFHTSEYNFNDKAIEYAVNMFLALIED